MRVMLAVLLAAAPHPGKHHQHHHRPHYREALGSEYGPKDSGGPLACHGQAPGIPRTLGYGTLGVANKTLPCGTRVTVCVRRCLTTQVIDRGPYCCNRSFDFTWRVARRLGLAFPWSGPMRWKLAH